MSSEPDTRARILDAALACAAENRLTMAAVAVQAGLSRQAVYLHFQDREALLAALARRLEQPGDPAGIASAPSARAAMAAMLARLSADYPRLRPVARLLAEDGLAPWQETRLAACREIAERFQAEGALSRHLSLDTASDLLWSLTGPAVWEELAMGRGWSPERYRSHVAYLAVSAVTK